MKNLKYSTRQAIMTFENEADIPKIEKDSIAYLESKGYFNIKRKSILYPSGNCKYGTISWVYDCKYDVTDAIVAKLEPAFDFEVKKVGEFEIKIDQKCKNVYDIKDLIWKVEAISSRVLNEDLNLDASHYFKKVNFNGFRNNVSIVVEYRNLHFLDSDTESRKNDN